MNGPRQFVGHHVTQENNENSSDDDDNWSESSYSSSYYSDSDSSIPDWDSSVDEKTGEVLYIECHPFVTQNVRDEKTDTGKAFSRNQTRRSTRGKFLRLLRRRESKRYSKRNIKIQESESHNTNKVKFQDFQEGEEREVLLKIKTGPILRGNNYLTESLLGIHIGTLSDGVRLMVAGFLQDSNAKYEKNIKIGDWLKSINNIEVNFQNINTVLQQFSGSNEVLIKLQRVAGVDVTKDPPINVLNNQSSFVRRLTHFNPEDDEKFQELLCKFPLGFVYLAMDKLDETGPEYQDVVYCYPRPIQKNILCNSKGIFLTLNHLLEDITKTITRLTSFQYNKTLCHVSYAQIEKNLLLLMLPDNCAKPFKLESLVGEVVRMLKFSYNTLDDCFKGENIHSIDHIFSMFFSRMLNSGDWTGEFKIPSDVSTIPTCDYVFEEALPAVHHIDLPKEAMIQVEDALTELEACDYREWNDEPLDCQRIFTMLGSAWYHSGYLLTSHLTYEDLVDVHCYCRHQGILHLSKTEPVKTLVVWREIFPSSCRTINVQIFKYPESRRYLLIVGSGKDLLVVIMEGGGSTEPPEEHSAPDPFYVEEAQATLAHLQELGISELADRFLDMNPGPQVTLPVAASSKKKLDVLNFTRSQQGQFRDPFSNTKRQEVTSILKKRTNDQSQMIYTSSYSLSEDTYDIRSEDSGSQGFGSERSELSSDDPIASQRNERRSSEESDNEENADDGQISGNSFDVSEMKQILLTETQDVLPIQITAGTTNVLYHYVQFDKLEGVLLSPPECRVESATRDLVIDNFRRCCQNIHRVFQNTLRFKDMSTQEMTKSVMNKSMIAIKEYGAMFECPVLGEKDSKKAKISYWVVGKLFFNPHAREMYVCYNDTIPQNAVELAFKLNNGFCD